ncbi:hypothetical protein SAMN04488543_3844 [Friedmanniella luteola]|uniref:Prenyltransferase and squalene oxidase repeat-containing protein n=1 Tax=Friedmanniella luteola TaxID=546871 RepID=A0A1H1ZL12_9ACTN|nr:hypothetical protein [Friedmanniella luteola]SDT34364.1 hypothetical protein SAMN04488543_3844 [Friedmanniella luteola]
MDLLEWLLDADPALRWQVLRDLTDTPAATAAAERARVASEGWGAHLLALRDPDGQWAGGACFPAGFTGDLADGQPWTSTLPSLELLCELGVDPDAAAVRESVSLVAQHCRWEHAGQPFFAGEVEACINGRTVRIGAQLGAPVRGVVDRLLGEQLADGGWNCEAENGSVRSSFDSTLCVLEGLRAFEVAAGGATEVAVARRRGEEYLLERGLFRRLSTGAVVDEGYLTPSFPTWWHYDVLRALDHFRAVGERPDRRAAEAVELVRSARRADGTWPAGPVHRGAVHLALEAGPGSSSRWITLRALRVLGWYDGGR